MKHILYLILSFIFSCIVASCNSTNKDISNKAILKLEKARFYEYQGDTQNAMICYLDVLDILSEKQDTVLKVNAYTKLGDFHFKYGMYEKAVENHRKGYNIALRIKDEKLIGESAVKLGLDYLLLNQKDTAQYFFVKYHQKYYNKDISNIIDYTYLSNIIDKDDKSLNTLIMTIKADTLGNLQEREKLIRMEDEFIQERALLKKENIKKQNMMNAATGLLLFSTFTSISFYLYRERKKAEVGLNRVLKEKTEREIYLSDKEEILQKQENELKKKKEQLLSDNNIGAIVLINRMRATPSYKPVTSYEDWDKLLKFTDSLYPGFLTQLDSVNDLTCRDKEISCLVKLGFTTGQLAVFYGISPGSITKAKFRIQKKLEAGSVT